MLELLSAFFLGLGIGLLSLAVYMKRNKNNGLPVFFDEKRYAELQKDLDDTLEKIRNIGWQTASARSIIDINNDERIDTNGLQNWNTKGRVAVWIPN